MTARAVRFTICVLVVAWGAACSDPISPGEALRISTVTGNGQAGVVGLALVQPLVIQARDHRDRPVLNLTVIFHVTSGGGRVSPETTTTAASGEAQATWVLGTSSVDSQRVLALVIDPRNGDSVGAAVFWATPRTGPIAVLAMAGGNQQSGDVGALLAQALAVRAEDAFGNPIPDVHVTWALSASATGGLLTPDSGTTSAAGIAQSSWRLGNRIDVTQSVVARISSPSLAATFTATPRMPSNATVTLVGNLQSARASTYLNNPIGVRVLQGSLGIRGVVVTLRVTAGGGQVTPDSLATDSAGYALAQWHLGGSVYPDTQRVEARVVDPQSGTVMQALSLRASGIPLPVEVRTVSGDSQSGDIGLPLAQPLAVRVLDANGTPVVGEPVTWRAVNSIHGYIGDPDVVASDSDGVARALWYLGERLDSVQVATASVAGVPPDTFTATPRLPALVTVERNYDGQSGIAGTMLPESLSTRVTVTGSTGQIGVRGATVAFAVQSGGGTIGPAQALTDADGFARAGWTVGAGSNTATATIGASSVGFSATGARPVAMSAVAAGRAHSCAIAATGETWCWGANDRGQLGVGLIYALSVVPVAVSGGHSFTSLAAGGSHTCALDAGGAAWCWGDNFNGQLGDSTFSTNLVPTAVAGGHAFVSLTAGESHTCGLTAAGAAWCWGDNHYGQIGDGSVIVSRNAPVWVATTRSFARLAAGRFHTCAVEATGAAWCWGLNQEGQLGVSPAPQTCAGVPCSLAPIGAPVSGVRDIQLGGDFTCALVTNDVLCWGAWDISVAQVPQAPTTLTRLARGATDGYACGLTSTDQAYCWNVYYDSYYYYYGRVITSAYALAGATSAPQLAGGLSHVCMIGSAATPYAYCARNNASGQLGDGTTQYRSTMTAVLFP